MGDRSADFRDRRRGGGTERETCDGGRWFAASEPVEEGGEHRQGRADHGGVAGRVVVADGHSDVIERSRRVAELGLVPRQTSRQIGLNGAVAAVLSDRQSPAAGFQRAVGIGVAEREPVGGEGVCERIGVSGGLGGVDQAVRGGSRLLTGTGERQCEYEACPGECVGVATACELGAAPFDRPFGLTYGKVRSGERTLGPNGTSLRSLATDHLTGVAVADSRVDPSGHPALRRDHVQGREPGVVEGAGGLD